MAVDIVEQIMYLYDEDVEKPIDILIQSPGGDIDAGLLIFDAMRESSCRINTICLGRASSMGAVLFAAGTGQRSMLRHSKLMIHEPYVSGSIEGNSREIRSVADDILKTKELCNRILSELTGKTMEEIESATSYDHFLTAEEAVRFGLADKIAEFHEIMEG